MYRTTRFLIRVAIVTAMGTATATGTAFADTEGNSNTSCMGHEASWASPPGSQDGTYSQHGMPGILQFVDEVAIPALDFDNRGEAISSGPAQINGDRTLASHEACDEALGIPEGAE